jgi:hypothetical protein
MTTKPFVVVRFVKRAQELGFSLDEVIGLERLLAIAETMSSTSPRRPLPQHRRPTELARTRNDL